MNNLCYIHQKAPSKEPCSICRRMRTERTIVRRLVRDLIRDGYKVHVRDLETDEDYLYKDTHDAPVTARITGIHKAMFTMDEDYLLVWRPGDDSKKAVSSFVHLVYGNGDGYEVICDHGVTISHLIDPVLEWADKLGSR